MSYNPKSANPFDANNTYKEWSGNNLILTDMAMRKKAGVAVLDSDISEIFNLRAQQGGAAYGAPFHMSHYASPQAVTYDKVLHHNMSAWAPQPTLTHKLATTQTGGEGSFPYRYFNA
jgi:hypothetical protein